MKFGLRDEDLDYIVQAVDKFAEIEKVVLFGSRAKGNYKPGSDIDLVFFGDKVDIHTISRLHSLLEDESPMPYFFDVVDGSHLPHQELGEHIARVGQVLFDRCELSGNLGI